MATLLVYTIPPYIPFTKILSASANKDKSDIQSRINWAGGVDAATGLGDDNIQSNVVAGGGLTRATKLKPGTPNYIVVNDGSGNMSETAIIPTANGGTGVALTVSGHSPGEVVQVNNAGTALEIAPAAGSTTAQSTKLFSYYRFS